MENSLKSYEEKCSLVRPGDYDQVISDTFDAIVLVRRTSDNIDRGVVERFDNYYTATISPPNSDIILGDKIVRQ